MKLMHTADWHLGKRLERFSRLEEQAQVLEEICQIAEQEAVQAVLIAGDIFDQFNPPTEAIQLFYRTAKRLSRNGECAVIVIAGNHDSPERIAAPDPLARECGIFMAAYPDTSIESIRLESGLEVHATLPGYCEMILPGETCPLRLILTPYANEQRLRTCLGFDNPEQELRALLEARWRDLASQFATNEGVNVLVGHLFMHQQGSRPPEEPDEERSILQVGGAQAVFTEALPMSLHYTALGHLHRYHQAASEPCPVVYSGSPLAYSLSEADQDKFVVIIEASPNEKTSIMPVQLKSGKRLLRERFDSVEAALQWLDEHLDSYVEVAIKTTHYLTAEDQHRLHQAHPGLLAVIPVLEDQEDSETHGQLQIQLEKTMEELFVDYFQFKKGQPPNSELIKLFREVLASEADEE